jgi:hypothetical protein
MVGTGDRIGQRHTIDSFFIGGGCITVFFILADTAGQYGDAVIGIGAFFVGAMAQYNKVNRVWVINQ